MMKQFLLALQFLTRIRWKEIPESPGRSMAYFPAVGFVLGVGLIFLDLALPRILPGLITDILLVVYLIWITGALHLDGVCDVADGVYAGKTTDEIRRIGTMAAVWLFCLLSLKIFSLAHLTRPIRYPVLLLMPVMGRWAMVWAASLCDYARSGEGLGREFCDCTDNSVLLKASWLPLLLLLVSFDLRGAVFLVGFFLLGTYGLIRWLKREIGGMTGDTFGAICEITEVWFLLLAHIFLI
jgi:adenosylcobinamide-GDP ribazoletransferase